MHAHHYIPSELDDYSRCDICGTLKHVNPLNPDEVYLDEYWSRKHNHPTLQEQVYNCDTHKENGVTKNQFVLDRIPLHSATVLEIGCAPGSTLNAIWREDRADELFGIEYDPTYSEGIKEIIGAPATLYFGSFPDTSIRKHAPVNVIIGLDILEHSFTPYKFLEECFLLLNDTGCLFLMLPLVGDDGSVMDRMRHREHVHLFSKSYMKEMLEEIGFKDIKFDIWCEGHNSVTAFK